MTARCAAQVTDPWAVVWRVNRPDADPDDTRCRRSAKVGGLCRQHEKYRLSHLCAAPGCERPATECRIHDGWHNIRLSTRDLERILGMPARD